MIYWQLTITTNKMTTTTTFNKQSIINKLQQFELDEVNVVDLELMLREIYEEDNTWFGLPTPNRYQIAAPQEVYSEYDAQGSKVVVRNYFRSLGDAKPGDEVLVGVQLGLQPATVQKNICGLLDTTKNKQFKRYRTTRTSDGILVTFE
jgi:hypothetical protein